MPKMQKLMPKTQHKKVLPEKMPTTLVESVVTRINPGDVRKLQLSSRKLTEIELLEFTNVYTENAPIDNISLKDAIKNNGGKVFVCNAELLNASWI